MMIIRERENTKRTVQNPNAGNWTDGEPEAPTQDLSLPVVDELARKDDGLMGEERVGPSADLETSKDQS